MHPTLRTVHRTGVALAGALALAAGAWAFCIGIVLPTPSGVTARPPDVFIGGNEWSFLHSSTNLQGRLADEKFAGGLFWFPAFPAPPELADFQSSVAVTNPHPTLSTGVTVEFFDQAGISLGTVPFTLAPEDTHVVPASLLLSSPLTTTPGLGSAKVTGHDLPIVGETVHHADEVDLSGSFGGPLVTDGEAFNLGLNSLQQLQMAQAGKTTLWFGPLPASNTAPIDFLSGNAPLILITNPNPSPTTLTLRYRSPAGILIGPVTVTLPGFGSLLDHMLWDQAIPAYLFPPGPFDLDFRLLVTADQPILGEALMVDLFGGPTLEPGERFRMASASLANSHPLQLINPLLNVEVANPGVETMVGLLNPTTAEVGPVTVRYFSRSGAPLGADTINPFPANSMVRIGPGLPASPNYPAAPVFAGWMRITSCIPGLVGWTVRQGGEQASAIVPKKAWGEELTGANGLEPGPGFAVSVGGSSFVRKVSPLVRVAGGGWPGHTNWLNDGVPNAGPYFFRFFDHFIGFPRTVLAGQPFAGLRFGATSFTYEDALATPTTPTNVSGRVDTTNGGFDGVHVIGDPLREWGVFEETPEEEP